MGSRRAGLETGRSLNPANIPHATDVHYNERIYKNQLYVSEKLIVLGGVSKPRREVEPLTSHELMKTPNMLAQFWHDSRCLFHKVQQHAAIIIITHYSSTTHQPH